MLIDHKCFECGFNGEVIETGRKVKCPKCNTINDVWFDDEEAPINHRREIVK